MRFCREREDAGFLSHLAARASHYGREQRFAQKPFWKQRMTQESQASARQTTGGPSRVLCGGDRITAGSAVQLVERPVIEGEFVEVRRAVTSSRAQRGVRYCGDLCVPDLMPLVSDRPTFDTLLSRYQRLHRDISAASFSRGIASLLEMQVLQRAG
jgi:hypothetical protein